jgi:TP901 family phage tail tape measure protein
MALTVAQLTARLTADTSNFYKSMSVADASLFRTGSIARRVGTGVGLAVAAMGLMALKSAGNFEQSMNVLAAVSQATTAEMKGMQDQAVALGKDMKLPNVSAADAADSMTELSKAGMSVKDVMGATRGVLQLGIASNMDFADSATIVARALTAFHMKGNQAVRVADLFTAAANKSTADVKDMALGVQMASAQWSAGRQPIENLTVALTLMANAGIAGSDAGTSLKTMMNRLMAPTSKAKEAMDGLGVSVYDSSGHFKKMPDIIGAFSKALGKKTEAERNATLYTIFGSDAVRAARVLITEGEAAWYNMATAVTRGGEAQEMAEAKTKGFNGAIQGFISQIETLAIELGMKMLPAATSAARALGDFAGNIDAQAITDFVGAISSGIKYFYELATANSFLAKALAITAAAFVALKFVLYPIADVFNRLALGLGKLSGEGSGFLKLSSVLGVVAGPAALFVGTAAALTIGMGMLTKALRDTAVTAQDVANSVTAANDAATKLTSSTNDLVSAQSGVSTAVKASSVAHKELESVQARVRSNDLTGKAAKEAVTKATKNAALADLNLYDARNRLTGAVVTEAKSVQAGMETHKTAIATAKENLRQLELTSNTMVRGTDYQTKHTAAVKAVSDATRDGSKFAKVHGDVITAIGKAGGPAAGSMKDLGRAMGDFNLNLGTKKLEDFNAKLETQAATAQGKGLLIGTGISTGIAAGIVSGPAVIAAVKVVEDAIAAAQAAVEIKSPSQVAKRKIGGPIAEGMAQGIISGSAKVENAAVSGVTNAATKAHTAAVAAAKKIGAGLLKGYISGSRSFPDKFNKDLKALINKAKTTIKNATPAFERWFARLSSGAMKAFDAITSSTRTASETALGGRTASETAFDAGAGAHDAAGISRQTGEAQAVIDGAESAKNTLARKANAEKAKTARDGAVDIEDIDQRLAERRRQGDIISAYDLQEAEQRKSEIRAKIAEDAITTQEKLISDQAQVDKDAKDARFALDEIAYTARQTALQLAGEEERKILEANAAQERLDYESRRELERQGLEDRIAKLQEGLLRGTMTVAKGRTEINAIFKASGVDAKVSGKTLGINFAVGMAQAQTKIVNRASQIARAISRILKLRSPAEEGPLSSLDTWWDAFVPTLTKGLDASGLQSAISGAVKPPALGVRGGSGGGSTINLTVTDQTFAGMSREQADRVAREVQAAIDRQVRSSV